ncbi:MAG: type II toxin-antitoxin system VapC family toxin [Blastocatellia bacterium]
MISSAVVDTDVVSYLFKGDTRGALYRPHIAGKLLLVSFMTLAELRQWALLKNWGERRRQELERFLEAYAIIHSDDKLCTMWAEVTRSAIRNGYPIDTADAWMAATALLHGIPLVTHNRNHYVGVDGLSILSEAP